MIIRENNYVSNVDQSTTGNIYGIYDINGGAWEYTAAGLTANVTSMFGSLTGFDEKYVNRYNGSTNSSATNYSANSGKYGDGIYETSNGVGAYGQGSWHSNFSGFVKSSYPFFIRGGNYELGDAAGTFAFDDENGVEAWKYRFPSGYCRVVFSLA